MTTVWHVEDCVEGLVALLTLIQGKLTDITFDVTNIYGRLLKVTVHKDEYLLFCKHIINGRGIAIVPRLDLSKNQNTCECTIQALVEATFQNDR